MEDMQKILNQLDELETTITVLKDEIKEQLKDTQARIQADQETILEEYLEQKKQLNRMERNIMDMWQYMTDLKKCSDSSSKS